jgi:hypothetical protein
MNLKHELVSLSGYVLYVRVNSVAHRSDTDLAVRGMITSGIDSLDKEMINSTQRVRVSILKLAEWYVKGISFDICDPEIDVIPVYDKITAYLTSVGKYLGTPGFRSLSHEARKEYQHLILSDAFVLEKLADALYPLMDSYDFERKAKKKQNNVLDMFRNKLSSGKGLFEQKMREEHGELYSDLNESAHRVALRTNLDEAVIYKYEDYVELGL